MKIKPIIITIVILVIIAILGFLYATRSVTSPSTNVESVTTHSTQAGVYHISQQGSKIEFRIGEILHGSAFTAVGTTSQVAGDIVLVDAATAKAASLSPFSLGTININAKTFKTDDPRRDSAITRFILQSEKPENEFIVFKPTNIEGVTGTIKEGQPFDFKVTGDLTVSGVTKPETLVGKAELVGGKITGTAEMKMKRSDFNLKIPNIPFVASVDDEFSIMVTVAAEQNT